MTNRILQFGTSRFLQAHADLFVHEARCEGQDIGPITIVKTTPGNARGGRIAAFGSLEGFPVRLKGYKAGQLIDETTQVTSVSRAIDANVEWSTLQSIFAEETEIVISNVGETGYDLVANEQAVWGRLNTAPKSFPIKLLSLLFYRYEKGGKPLLILPCELVSNNGRVLRVLLLKISHDFQASKGFIKWLEESITFCDTLVDRIVSEAIDPVGAIGEPYGLWAIKREHKFIEPFQHPCIVYTDDLEPYLRLKLHILNLGHTFLAEIWKTENRPELETVREILEDSAIKQRLMALYHEEVVPGFVARGLGERAAKYVKVTIERFENPFLNHRIGDIAQNHHYKIERRMIDFMHWARNVKSDLNFKSLEAIVAAAGDEVK
jgi:tagaturonate reductase